MLPLNGLGALLLRLTPETKSSRSTTADVVLAFETLTRLRPGMWFLLAHQLFGHPPDDRPIFLHPDGSAWTSLSFRTSYLYPALRALQRRGDAYLRPYNGPAGNTLEDKFWSLHCFRRGSRTHVSRRHLAPNGRIPSPILVYEHARWRLRRSSENIDLHYQQWTIRDRIVLTLYYM